MAKFQRMMMVLLCAGFLATTTFTGCAGTQARETTERVGSDSWITAKVKTAMADDLMLKTFAVNVETFDGVVQLSGFVDNAEQKSKAGEVAKQVKGVKSVKNDIRVKQ
jgi:osmotically-inducible protein OsmY